MSGTRIWNACEEPATMTMSVRAAPDSPFGVNIAVCGVHAYIFSRDFEGNRSSAWMRKPQPGQRCQAEECK